MYLAGLRSPDEDVRELITLVDEPTRSFLEKALALESAVVAPTIEDRERILWRSTMSERTCWQSFVCVAPGARAAGEGRAGLAPVDGGLRSGSASQLAIGRPRRDHPDDG